MNTIQIAVCIFLVVAKLLPGGNCKDCAPVKMLQDTVIDPDDEHSYVTDLIDAKDMKECTAACCLAAEDGDCSAAGYDSSTKQCSLIVCEDGFTCGTIVQAKYILVLISYLDSVPPYDPPQKGSLSKHIEPVSNATTTPTETTNTNNTGDVVTEVLDTPLTESNTTKPPSSELLNDSVTSALQSPEIVNLSNVSTPNTQTVQSIIQSNGTPAQGSAHSVQSQSAPTPVQSQTGSLEQTRSQGETTSLLPTTAKSITQSGSSTFSGSTSKNVSISSQMINNAVTNSPISQTESPSIMSTAITFESLSKRPKSTPVTETMEGFTKTSSQIKNSTFSQFGDLPKTSAPFTTSADSSLAKSPTTSENTFKTSTFMTKLTTSSSSGVEKDTQRSSTTFTTGDERQRSTTQPVTGSWSSRSEYSTEIPMTSSSSEAETTSKTTLKGPTPVTNQEVMSAGLIALFSVGIIFFFCIMVLLGKRIFDSWQRRHYSRMDYLINGMYN